MPLESTTVITGLQASNPTGTDNYSSADDHIRLVKNVLKTCFPNIGGAVSATHSELSFVAGVTSAIQTQLNAKEVLASKNAVNGYAGLDGTAKLANAQVAQSNVTQHQASLSITWGQITGTKNADQLQGFTPAASVIANTLLLRDASGYAWAQYFNQASGNNENPAISQVMVNNGSDGFLRKASSTYFQSQLSLNNIGGQVSAGQVPSGAVTQYQGTFSLAGSQITSGTVAAARLPNVGTMPGVTIQADPGGTPSGSVGQLFLYY